MSIARDLRLAVRLMIKGRWFTLAAAATLALGISVNTAVFTLSDAVLFRGIPFKDSDRVVLVTMRDARNRELGVSYLDLLDWRAAARSFSNMSLMVQMPFNVGEAGHAPERYAGASVSYSLFKLLDTDAHIGRPFTAADDQDGAPAPVVISYGMWQSRYAGDPSVLGRTIRTNDLPVTIVGVMKRGMQFPPNTDLWLSLERSAFARRQGRDTRVFHVLARLADGVTIPQAQSELEGIVADLAKTWPATNRGIRPVIGPYNERVLGSQIKLVFHVLMGAVAFVLLIACANVANLQLSRAADRAREISIRLSLGSTRWQIIRQLLVESVLLALLGGVLGQPLSMYGVHLFDGATQNVGKPFWMVFTLDARVFAFFFAVCVLTGIIFGLAPAWHISKTNINEVLKESGRSGAGGIRARRWASVLLVSEVAFMVVLLSSAGFMMRSFFAIYRLDLGIDTSRLLVMQLTLTDRKYPTQAAKRNFLRRLDDRLATVNALEAVTTASYWPLGGGLDYQLHFDDRPVVDGQTPPVVTMVSTGRRYFESLGVRVTRGRNFTDDDSAMGREGAIVNERFVDLHLKGEDPIGRRIRLRDDGFSGVGMPMLTIVGVAGNLRQRITPNLDPDPIVYVRDLAIPNLGRPTALIVRTRSAAAGTAAQILRDEVRALDGDIPVVNVQTLDQSLAEQRWTYRVFGFMFGTFATLALILAAVGLYAVTAYSVTQRTQEVGVRTALGAQPGQVMWLFLRQALLHVGIGLTIGLAGALAVGQLLQSLLISTSAHDAVTLVSIVGLTVVVSIAACLWPAQRATRLDPVLALRRD